MWTLLFSTLALAAPDRVAATYDLGSGLGALTLSPDGRTLGVIEQGSGELRLLDTDTWDADSLASAPCTDPAGVAAWDASDGLAFYVGCADGSVVRVLVSDGEVSKGDAIAVGDGPILGLVAGDSDVYVLEDPGDGGNPVLHVLDPDSDSVDSTGDYPVSLGHSGYVDIAYNGSYVLVLHGSDNVSKVDPSTGGALTQESSVSATCTDLSASSSGSFLMACGAKIVRFITTTNLNELALTDDDGLVNATALTFDEADSLSPSLLIADAGADALLVFDFSTSTGYPEDDLLDAVALDGLNLSDMVSAEGYTFGADGTGALAVLTDLPWVSISEVSPSLAIDGDEVSVAFTADVDGSYELRLSDDRDSAGTLLASGTVAAGVENVAVFTVDSAFAEGDNRVFVIVESDSGKIGHAATDVLVDNPPSQVQLYANSVGFGNQSISLKFEGVTDEDLDHYVFYLSTEAFSAEDYESGGPDLDGDDGDEYPRELSAEPGGTVQVTLSPLTNGQTYYVAARAVDAGGQEGLMSDVLSATPEETYSLSELTGESGGFCGCASGPSGRAVPLAGLLAGLAVALRRRRGLAAVALATVSLSSTAIAGDEPQPRGGFQMRYGPVWFEEDNTINDAFGERGNEVIWLETGRSWRGLIEVDAGLGWFQEMGFKLGESGGLSDDHDMLTAIPLTASLTARLDLLKEQPIVPYAAIGGDYWLWRENWYDNVNGRDQISGGKRGWHYALGGQILLDAFDPKHASALEARTGIKDTYLTVEWRKQTVGGYEDGLEFTGHAVSAGLRLNY